MSNEELESQLSAMFDDELPAPECELLARRLARDESLKARWGHYAVIGAAIRSERHLRIDGVFAGRVSAAVAAEAPLASLPTQDGRPQSRGEAAAPWWQPIAGGALAAGVAAAAILWLRGSAPIVPAITQLAAIPAVVATPPAAAPAADSDSYVLPQAVESPSFAPPTELADFVVAHSEFSTPLLRRSALSALIASEAATGGTLSAARKRQAPAPNGASQAHAAAAP